MNPSYEIRHAASGLAKSFHSKEAVAEFLRTEEDPEAWEGWQRLNIALRDEPAPAASAAQTEAPAPAPTAVTAATTKAPAKKTAPAKKAAAKK